MATKKRLTKPEMKKQIAATLAKVASGRFKWRGTEEVVTLEAWLKSDSFVNVQKEMAERGISRKSVYDTMACNFAMILTSEQLKAAHDFVFKYL